MIAKRIFESKFCRFLFSVDPCGGVQLDFARKMKLLGETRNNGSSTQFFVLILNLMRSRVLVLSFGNESDIAEKSLFSLLSTFPSSGEVSGQALISLECGFFHAVFQGLSNE
jgi:hypothetical protein